MAGMTPFDFLAPSQLQVAPETLRRVQLIGGCIFDYWGGALADLVPTGCLEAIVIGHDALALAEADLRIVQLPMRIMFGEWTTMPLGIESEEPYARILHDARAMLDHYVLPIIDAPARAPTLLLNYLLPQQNPFGRFFPRYDLRNPVHMVECFNRMLADVAAAHPHVHVLDADRVAAVYGRRLIQDDPFWLTGHNGLMSDGDVPLDGERLEPEEPVCARYGHDPHGYVRMVWREAIAMLRTIRGTDRIKMVCVDLDDTLWRGVLADQGQLDMGMAEGWPMGMAEALTILRRRGVILAIVSKNDEAFVESAFPQIFGDRMKIESFPIRKINWRSKVDNLREAIAEANVLPGAVLFIDDNPIERAQAQAAFPDLRILGAPHLDWRRILLWSPELQSVAITDESLHRNDMIAAQLRREDARAAEPGDFLANLGVTVKTGVIASSSHARFARGLELVNKTNQFNTTGRRWTQEEAEAYFATGGRWTFAIAADRFTQYGLVALAATRRDRIDQIVMSCRVFGLGVEAALIAEVAREQDARILSGSLIETERNGPCRLVFANLGWVPDGDIWTAIDMPMPPAHVAMSADA